MKKYHKQILIIYGQNDNIVAHALQPAELLTVLAGCFSPITSSYL